MFDSDVPASVCFSFVFCFYNLLLLIIHFSARRTQISSFVLVLAIIIFFLVFNDIHLNHPVCVCCMRFMHKNDSLSYILQCFYLLHCIVLQFVIKNISLDLFLFGLNSFDSFVFCTFHVLCSIPICVCLIGSEFSVLQVRCMYEQ